MPTSPLTGAVDPTRRRRASPGDLPIERATKIHLTINLGTAKARGLAIPQTLLLQVDEIIQ